VYLRDKRRAWLAVAVAISLAAGSAAAETAKKPAPSMSFDNPTVGTLGGHRGPADGSVTPPAAKAHPSAPIPAVPTEKVDAGSAVMPSGPNNTVAPLQADPRPEARPEGPAVGVGMPTPGTSAPVAQAPADGFLAQHQVISGLVAGLFGTGIGSLLYGGPMMGDETAAMIGYLIRAVVIIGLAFGIVKVLWSLMNRAGRSPERPLEVRREPSLGRSEPEFGGGRREPRLRREPTLGAVHDEPSLFAGEPRLARRAHSGLTAGPRR
jgi:hypothetical protein